MDADGNFVQSDYIEPGRNDLYVVCHNCPEVTFPWAHAYIDKAMSFGAAGMFLMISALLMPPLQRTIIPAIRRSMSTLFPGQIPKIILAAP